MAAIPDSLLNDGRWRHHGIVLLPLTVTPLPTLHVLFLFQNMSPPRLRCYYMDRFDDDPSYDAFTFLYFVYYLYEFFLSHNVQL